MAARQDICYPLEWAQIRVPRMTRYDINCINKCQLLKNAILHIWVVWCKNTIDPNFFIAGHRTDCSIVYASSWVPYFGLTLISTILATLATLANDWQPSGAPTKFLVPWQSLCRKGSRLAMQKKGQEEDNNDTILVGAVRLMTAVCQPCRLISYGLAKLNTSKCVEIYPNASKRIESYIIAIFRQIEKATV